jgi:fructose-1-phosphate kinase PfkB-like protein
MYESLLIAQARHVAQCSIDVISGSPVRDYENVVELMAEMCRIRMMTDDDDTSLLALINAKPWIHYPSGICDEITDWLNSMHTYSDYWYEHFPPDYFWDKLPIIKRRSVA